MQQQQQINKMSTNLYEIICPECKKQLNSLKLKQLDFQLTKFSNHLKFKDIDIQNKLDDQNQYRNKNDQDNFKFLQEKNQCLKPFFIQEIKQSIEKEKNKIKLIKKTLEDKYENSNKKTIQMLKKMANTALDKFQLQIKKRKKVQEQIAHLNLKIAELEKTIDNNQQKLKQFIKPQQSEQNDSQSKQNQKFKIDIIQNQFKQLLHKGKSTKSLFSMAKKNKDEEDNLSSSESKNFHDYPFSNTQQQFEFLQRQRSFSKIKNSFDDLSQLLDSRIFVNQFRQLGEIQDCCSLFVETLSQQLLSKEQKLVQQKQKYQIENIFSILQLYRLIFQKQPEDSSIIGQIIKQGDKYEKLRKSIIELSVNKSQEENQKKISLIYGVVETQSTIILLLFEILSRLFNCFIPIQQQSQHT